MSDLAKLVAAMTPDWRRGSVETDRVFVPSDHTGIGHERVLLRFNAHFEHEVDAAGMMALYERRADLARVEPLENGVRFLIDAIDEMAAQGRVTLTRLERDGLDNLRRLVPDAAPHDRQQEG